MLIDRSFVTRKTGLRSDGENLLVVPVTKLKIASRSFAVCGPGLWNGLPHFLKRSGQTLP